MGEMIREIVATPDGVARRGADLLAETVAETEGPVAIALSGGSTPKRLYELLTQPAWCDRIDWPRVHWFWGDERFVPPDHPDSNYRMTRLAMLAQVPAPEGNIHPIPTLGLTPDEAAARYEETLRGFPRADGQPFFDLTLLGLGEDGHTASLFPGTAAVDETEKWVTAVVGAKPEPRISLTLPVLNRSARVLFLVTGAAKHAVLGRLEAGEDLPAGRVRPVGTLHWLLDRAAAEGN